MLSRLRADEWVPFKKWRSLPHSELYLPSLRIAFPVWHDYPVTPRRMAEVAKFPAEQVRKFELIVSIDPTVCDRYLKVNGVLARPRAKTYIRQKLKLSIYKRALEGMVEVLKEDMAEALGVDMEEVEERLRRQADGDRVVVIL